ncbi:MAG TPA: amidase family protein [Steroidobacteraceae bacterium]|nr:amidase family protein [Steroidobacteraceae bacterium]HVY82441.1 amidase family protein [Steroidobacteraceae bacterium]
MFDRDIEHALLQGSLKSIGQCLRAKRLSVQEMTGWYLARIAAFNHQGPALNAVRVVSDHALEDARRADAELATGRDRGPLHGIPVLIKDNILIADEYTTTAGAAALASFVPKQTATIVQRLRSAGAIVLGKTNLTEFADYVADVMPAEFSSAGGVVKNPHGIRYGRGQGSSVGSAAAVAASFAPIAIGGETQNSIQTPASYSSVVGFKPSVGRVSRVGIMPLVPSQDAPGVLARSVADAQTVYDIIGGADAHDPVSMMMPRDDRRGLRIERLAQVSIGVPRRAMADRADFAPVAPLLERVLQALSRAGAIIVDPCDMPSAEQILDIRSCVFRTEFKASLNAFLEAHGAPCGIGSLEELIRWNEAHPEMIPYGQSLLLAAQETRGINDPVYRADRARDIALSRTAGIDATLQAGNVDVLIAPMGAAAKCTGKAGAPTLAIPAGLDASGTPFGVTLYTSFGSDAVLVAVARLVEQAIGDRRQPAL